MSFNSKSNFTLKTDDQRRKHGARVAIMTHRLSLGIIDENCKRPYPVTAVGTMEQVAALREKWGIG